VADVTRDKLARGTRLTRQHVSTPLTAIAAAMSASIQADKMKDGWSTFSMAWHIPVLWGPYWLGPSVNVNEGFQGSMILPFVLPPTQDKFSTIGTQDPNDPKIVLEEFSFSFDQRGESAMTFGAYAGAEEGLLSEDSASSLSALEAKLVFSLREKNSQIWNSAAKSLASKSVFELEYPLNAAFSDFIKLNPFVQTGLEQEMHPYRTYVLTLDASQMVDSSARSPAGVHPSLMSAVIRLKFRSELMVRDTTAAPGIQNIPTKHNGLYVGESITITSPAGNSQIEADSADGVQTNIATIDQRFTEGLKGGYDEFSDTYPKQHINSDAGYEVLVVPMWQTSNGFITKGMGLDLPYVGGAGTVATGDRRIIPLKYPITIQHVVAVSTWAGPLRTANIYRRPALVTFTTEIGVGIGVGLRADNHAYQQVAYATWTALEASKAPFRIDKIQASESSSYKHENDRVAAEMFQIPLVHAGNASKGVGFLTAGGTNLNGHPVFAGRSPTGTSARTNISSGTLAGSYGASAISGQDQFLEVRWNFRESVGLEHASVHADTAYVGFPGHWVYIYCKKHLA